MKPKLPPPPIRGTESGMSRRGFIQGVVVASAATAALGGLPIAAPELVHETAAVAGLSAGHRRLLSLVLNRLIPKAGAMPGAGDCGVAVFIEQAVQAAPHLRAPIAEVLDALPDENSFGRLSDVDADRLLRGVEEHHPLPFDLLIQATYAGYYGHSDVQSILGWTDPSDAGSQAGPFDSAAAESAERSRS